MISGGELTDRAIRTDTLATMPDATPDATSQPDPPVADAAGATDGAGGSESLSPDEVRGTVWASPLAPEAAVEALRAASRRGKLAGFRTLDASSDSPPDSGGGAGVRRCACDVFGSPYDRDLFIAIAPGDGGGSTVRLDTRLRRKFPAIVIVVMVLAVWPGVWLTDSLLVTYFGWYPRSEWVTWAWYVPLMLLAVPVLIKQYRSSEAMAAVEAARVVRKLRRLTNAV